MRSVGLRGGQKFVRELKHQFGSALLVITTVAAIFAAGVNFQQQKKYRLPQDGVTWTQRGSRVEALHVVANGPADRAGLKRGDRVVKINGVAINKALDVTRVIFQVGDAGRARYEVIQNGVPVTIPVIIGSAEPDPFLSYQYGVALVYLLLGLFVYFRRGAAPRALHFYLLCLVSFIQYSFHYTGKLNNFDKVIYWGNLVASVLAPTIFFHFCLAFPKLNRFLRKRWIVLYLPAAVLLTTMWAVINGVVRVDVPLVELRWLLDRPLMLYWAAVYLAGAGVLLTRYWQHHEPVLRRQFAWICLGVLLGILPFTLLYVMPYALGYLPSGAMRLSILTLVLVPLTWGYAIVRHRLLEVDVVFQQGYVYTLSTIGVIGVLYALFFQIGKFNDLSPVEVVALIFVATFVFQPIRNFMQEMLDRNLFYRSKYEPRLSLIQFVRELSSHVGTMPMMRLVAERLLATLGVRQVAFFLWDDTQGRFQTALHTEQNASGERRELEHGALDLSFLSATPEKPYLFFETTRGFLDVNTKDLQVPVRQTIADLDLTYYLPCQVRGKVVAYLGVSRTLKDDFLPSDDVELLTTLAGYVAIALDNSLLYQSLQRKVEEVERLREFNENIVQSINVGVLAVDLADRVESWNSVMERLTGVAREQALGRRLDEVLPKGVLPHWDDLRAESGEQQRYKLTWCSPAGERIINLGVAPLLSAEQEQIGRLLIVDDVTDRSDLERQLLQAEKLSSVGLLAAGVAHEVNTPLAVISTYAQMLAKQVNGDQQKAAILEKIAKQTFRASEIVNSLLNFSRTAPREHIQVDLNRIAQETVTLVEPQLTKANVALELDLEAGLGDVKGNPGQLQQVLLNLILNARDAMKDGGMVRLRSYADGDFAVLCLSDTGEGIPPENLKRIFDPFFTTKGFGKGTGLGLSVTYGIVQEHAGTIEVDSQPGRGTEFTLRFPLVAKPVHA